MRNRSNRKEINVPRDMRSNSTGIGVGFFPIVSTAIGGDDRARAKMPLRPLKWHFGRKVVRPIKRNGGSMMHVEKMPM